MSKFAILKICLVAAAVRLFAIYVGLLVDNFSSSVHYTDIDYNVFSDAAILVANGQSPYGRVTYRYPPVVAWILMPTQHVPSFGKLLFSLADVMCTFEIYSIIKKSSNASKLLSASQLAYMWALNPLNINMCTRGSMDAVANWLCLFSLCMVLQRKYKLAGLAFGCVIHLRLFPVIYVFSFIVYILFNESKTSMRLATSSTVIFLASTSASCTSMTAISWFYFGFEYLENAVWYHLIRSDHRHNFSFHFYGTYLQMSEELLQGVRPNAALPNIGPESNIAIILFNKIVFFLPQLMIILAISFVFARKNLPVALLLQTMTFVTFNKVITAQYFIWYLPFLYIVAPEMLDHCFKQQQQQQQLQQQQQYMNTNKLGFVRNPLVHLVGLLMSWLVALSVWLWRAYLLEFESENTFYSVWLASIVFFIVNCCIICFLAYSLRI